MTPQTPSQPAKKRSFRLVVWIFLGLLLVGGGLGAYFYKTREKPILVTVEKATVRRLVQVVSASGRVQPEIEVKISAEVSGEIIELPVVEGKKVSKGDLLVRLKPDFYQTQVEQQTAAVEASRARVRQNIAQLEKATLDFQQIESLFGRGLVSENEFNNSRAAQRVAAANLEAARAEAQRSEGSLRQSQDQFSKTVLYAPIDASVSILNSKIGERLVAQGQFSGTEIMRLANLSQMEVRVNVNENDVVNVAVGQTAKVRIDAYGDREFRGTVREIANTARTTAQSTADEVTNFEVRISLDSTDFQLRPGMSATADIETKVVESTVSVPIQSVTVRSKAGGQNPDEMRERRQGDQARPGAEGAPRVTVVKERDRERQERQARASLRRIVFVYENGVVRQRAVETGIMDNSHMQIFSGVSADEQVVSGSYAAITRLLKDGTAVEIEKTTNRGKESRKK